jgi:tetratricopeptide (TPR) repeat protein
MSLCSDDEYDLKQVLLHMKQQIGSGETNLRTLGKILWKMGKLDLAEKYFKRLLSELPSDVHLLFNLYEDLGEIASLKGDYDISIQWHQKSLEVKKKNELAFKSNSNTTDNSIGEFIERNSIIFKRRFYRRID